MQCPICGGDTGWEKRCRVCFPVSASTIVGRVMPEKTRAAPQPAPVTPKAAKEVTYDGQTFIVTFDGT
jgi:hypothetical protein